MLLPWQNPSYNPPDHLIMSLKLLIFHEPFLRDTRKTFLGRVPVFSTSIIKKTVAKFRVI